ncbi:HupE/UreJ family protein [Muriicola sp. Z0-33]|uniref:HupE/UreJ family protein n=1 Tax=Muriicola sp. Z0-33 TaxID=2816957 RepID=UPI0022377A97|nr:HupE/UreJ family protein [Muriicola sp. Z0-33]MCW5515231.1 HupE/UreJ family protein [Muriicola sp. Z0-33]
MKRTLVQLVFIIFLLIPISIFAHRPDRSLIYLRVYESATIEGRFEMNAVDISTYLGIDLPKHPTVEEVKEYEDQLQAYILKNAAFSSINGDHKIIFTGEISLLKINIGTFVAFHFELDNTNPPPDDLEVTFSVFLDENPAHSNGLGMEYNWKAGLINNEKIIALEFTQSYKTKTLSLTDTSLWKGFVEMIRQGIWHIWIGLDHILFILALILPSVVRRRKDPHGPGKGNKIAAFFMLSSWEPVKKFRPAFWYILKVITFFTIAHTITLSLASLNLISLPSRIVESVIALSIGLAAYHNIRPIFRGRDWVIAFVFGLFHGFGFATVLSELGFNGEFLTLSLLGFNIGVEIGQVAIIALIFPMLYFIRNLKLYPIFLTVLSVLLIFISLYWFIERSLEIDLLFDNYLRKEAFKLAVLLGLR